MLPVFIFSAVLILIVIVSAIIGMARGFVKSIAKFVQYVVAYIVANRCYVLVASLFMKIPFLANMTSDVEMPDIPEGTGFFERIGKIVSYVASGIFSGEINNDETVKAIINNYLADAIAKIIAFLALFVVTVLLLKLLVLIIDKLSDLPVLKAVNRTLGFIFGLVCGLTFSWLLANLTVHILLPWFVEKWPDTFTIEMGETVVVQFFAKYSPVAMIMYLVNLLSSIGIK
ncbi:MAG: CvpA family protein [Clostridia bacterium]|nr:CvpA family protein [Clostridia bacterium]MBO4429616.1 CvpA family protein [Clostridia bacterium]